MVEAEFIAVPHILFTPVPVHKLILLVSVTLLFLTSPKIPPLFFALVLFTNSILAIQFVIVASAVPQPSPAIPPTPSLVEVMDSITPST